MKDAIVIGCGIIGATITSALRQQGRSVLTLDCGKSNAGTGPSGGHLRPEWFKKLPKEEYEPAIELLDSIWGVETRHYLFRDNGTLTTVHRVDTDKITRYPRTYGVVTAVNQRTAFPAVSYKTKAGDTQTVEAAILVVSAGVWTSELIRSVSLVGKQGISFRFRGQIEAPYIQTWAPYKQVVAHQQSEEEIWIGDGSAIIPQNWNEERTNACLDRCRGTLPKSNQEMLGMVSGIRPYAKPITETDPCLIQQVTPKIWVVTGAGKSGTIAAGWSSRRILDATN